jgi:Icc-related predicted phosphoesterase
VIRVGAVGDVHMAEDNRGRLRPALDRIAEHADVLLLAGDLTKHGTLDEARVVADEFADLAVPVIAVLGNHDHHGDVPGRIAALLAERGIQVLDGESVVVPVNGRRLGVAGVKGFGGGFAGRCASAFGEPEMKAFVHRTTEAADRLRTALAELTPERADVTVALTHYSPVADTLRGEPPEIYPFLGAYQLAEAIDATGTDLALHGHAHFGCERGVTPGGVRVRNVAQPVIDAAYRVYRVEPDRAPADRIRSNS